MRIVSIVSARPNFIKLAALHHALKEHAPKWEHIIIHTGQHYDPLLSEIFFKELNIPEPHENLGVKGGASNDDTVARTKEAALPILKKLQPELVLVYGDVSGALGGALAAHELKIPIAHVEAGLRSFDDAMPEEGNRKAIDHLSAFLFVTEQSGMDNLQNEGITKGVHHVGNTMIDTLMRMTTRGTNFEVFMKQKLPSPLEKLEPRHFGLVTLHRPSNVDNKENLERCIDFMNSVACKECSLIFPVHFRTQAAIQRFGLQSKFLEYIRRIDPLGYLPFIKLMIRSKFVITDSGGIQEETAFLGIKCFTLRRNTERPITLKYGNQLVNLNDEKDKKSIITYARVPVSNVPKAWSLETTLGFGGGHAGEEIVKELSKIPIH